MSLLIMQIRRFVTNLLGVDLLNWWKGYTGKLCRKFSRIFFFYTGLLFFCFCFCFFFYAFSVLSSFGLSYEAWTSVKGKTVNIFSLGWDNKFYCSRRRRKYFTTSLEYLCLAFPWSYFVLHVEGRGVTRKPQHLSPWLDFKHIYFLS